MLLTINFRQYKLVKRPNESLEGVEREKSLRVRSAITEKKRGLLVGASRSGVKLCDIYGEMIPLVFIGLFCIGRSEFVFHLDGKIIRDG